MRSIMLRGWGMDHMQVYLGYVVVLGWAALFVFLSAVGIRSVN
jgi:hypothetical protein